MKATFQTTDPKEAKRLSQANDLAICLWEILNNGWRDFKDTDYDYHRAWDKINEIVEEHGINVNELID